MNMIVAVLNYMNMNFIMIRNIVSSILNLYWYMMYSQLSLSRSQRDPLKHFEISIL